MLGVVRLVLRGRDVVPDFRNVCVFGLRNEDFRDRPSSRNGDVLCSLIGVSNFDTFCDCFLKVIFGLAVWQLFSALLADVTSILLSQVA